jgi:hypothetical protein
MKTFDLDRHHAIATTDAGSEIAAEHEVAPRRLSRHAARTPVAGQVVGEDTPATWSFGDAINAGIHDAGAGLPDPLRARFEASLGTDLGGVRVHDGATAARASASFGARAFAVGQDIVMGGGQYAPHTADGASLLAHEVAHTVQQRGAAARPQLKLEVSERGDACETEADAAASAMVAGTPVTISATAAGILRTPHDHETTPAEQPATGGGAAELRAAIESATAPEASRLLAALRAARAHAPSDRTELTSVGAGGHVYRVPNDALEQLELRAEARIGLETLRQLIAQSTARGITQLNAALLVALQSGGSDPIVEVAIPAAPGIPPGMSTVGVERADLRPLIAQTERDLPRQEARETPELIDRNLLRWGVALAQFAMTLTPVIGQLISLGELVTQRSFMTGERLTATDNVLIISGLVLEGLSLAARVTGGVTRLERGASGALALAAEEEWPLSYGALRHELTRGAAGAAEEASDAARMTYRQVVTATDNELAQALIRGGKTHHQAEEIVRRFRVVRPEMALLSDGELWRLAQGREAIEHLHQTVEGVQTASEIPTAAGGER